jgi:hypothetical protein
MTDLRQYYSACESNETCAIELVKMYIKDHIEAGKKETTFSYTIDDPLSKNYYNQFALRYLEPMLFSSGYWGNVKHYTKRGKITAVVNIYAMTEEEKKDNGVYEVVYIT